MKARLQDSRTGHIALRDLLGWSGTENALWARVRATQLQFLLRALPMSCATLAVQTLVLMIAFAGTPSAAVVLSWGGLTLVLVGLRLRRWRMTTRSGPLREASPKLMRGATVQAATMALSWAGIILYLFPRSDGALQIFVACMHMGLMGGGAFIFATVPTAAFAYTLILMAAMLINELTRASGLPQLVYPMCGIYMLVILQGVLAYTRTLILQVLGEAELREHDELIGMLLNEYEENGSDWLWDINAEGELERVTPRMAAACGRPVHALVGSKLLALLDDSRVIRAPELLAFEQKLKNEQPFRGLLVPVEIDGARRWWSLTAAPRIDETGTFRGYRGVASDVTDVRRSQEQIVHMARYDALTGLLNRGALQATLDEVIARAARFDTRCAVLFIDLDRFKAVNDTLGHPMGDRLLRECASRIELEAGAEARAGRLGGDEFAVILPNPRTRNRVFELADRILGRLSEPFVIDGQRLEISGSIGISFGPTDGATSVDLLGAADLALYRAKSAGRGVWCRYLPDMRREAEERLGLERDLRSALELGQFSLEFQPIVEGATGEIVSMEALLRWTHPELGPISPVKFIPIAEEAGLIDMIGGWVIRTACAEASRWPEHVRVSVNLSPRQLSSSNLAAVVVQALAVNGIAPKRLELELTENVFLQATPHTTAVLSQLTQLGVTIALDDFGTGYSSLGYLQKARFSTIKIDRSFTQAAPQGGESAAIIRSIVTLADSLGMRTVAEGAETIGEVETARSLGCLHVQGYFFSRPVGADAAAELARGGRTLTLVKAA